MKKKYDNATEAALKFITPPADKPQKAPEPQKETTAKKTTATRKKPGAETDSTPQKKSDRKSPFSVWLDQKTAADLKMYSAIGGEKTTDIVERALKEYMNRHKLTEDQKTAYKQKMMKNLNDI